jgi:hypothetical protein
MRYNDATRDWDGQSIDGLVALSAPRVEMRAGAEQSTHADLSSKGALSDV